MIEDVGDVLHVNAQDIGGCGVEGCAVRETSGGAVAGEGEHVAEVPKGGMGESRGAAFVPA